MWSMIQGIPGSLRLYIAAGIPIGTAAGYVSHLVLDAGTPRGIPLIARGF
jgi:hypothetical protein